MLFVMSMAMPTLLDKDKAKQPGPAHTHAVIRKCPGENQLEPSKMQVGLK